MLKDIIRKMLSALPVRNVILFESMPDLSDNPVAVFREMIDRGFNKKYKFVWLVSKNEKYPEIKNVSYCRRGSKLFKLKLIYYRLFAKAIVCGNDFIVAIREKQKTFYLSHGTAIKSVRSYYTVPENVNYLLVDGEGTREMMAYQFNKELEKTIALGYPRNDVLFNCKRDISDLFPEAKGQKIVVWYPTFRQHKNHSTADATKNTLPIIHDEEAAVRLNEMAKANGILIVLKPHFAQDVSRIKAQNLSNLIFIDDDF
ncbi:MAG: CDP-glycerol glycerophosphotransferase family protein, partial [Clostridia bacterium]|nr:CDP-glycerol glycerophosphotransferase family protein [Clostridia bacterium]